MAALTYKFNMLRISYVDGCITFYPNFQYYDTPGLRNCLKAIVKACCEKEFEVKLLKDQKPTTENLDFIQILHDIQYRDNFYSRFINRNDVDHWLYHKDNYNYNDSHYHIKFRSILTAEHIETIMDICREHHLIDENEKKSFLKALQKRYANVQQKLTAQLTFDKQKDVPIILKFIMHCEDNDVIANLHNYLLSPKFNYIRDCDLVASDTHHWQGTLESGKLGKVSAAWAAIEKNMSLQIIENIRVRCYQLDKKTARGYADELNRALCFFAIKRKDNSFKKTNNVFRQFQEANNTHLQNKHQKVMAENAALETYLSPHLIRKK